MQPNRQLKRERERKGWSQRDLAEQLGTTSLTVSRWECGVTTPKAYLRHKLCELFAKSAEELGFLPQDTNSRSDNASQPAVLDPEQTLKGLPEGLRDPMIPPLFEKGENLLGREKEFHLLKHQLQTHAGSLAIFGLPGVGKTALAAALAQVQEVREGFRDGILWVGLGREPQPLRLLSRWGTLLGLTSTEMAKLTTINTLAMAIRDLIGTRRMLLIIDDAWSIKDALDFKVGGMQCVHLVTTRFPPIALHFASNAAFPIHELSEDDSLLLLQRLAPSVMTAESSEARELVRSVGGLPLALTLMGKYLQLQACDHQPRHIRSALEQLRHVDMRLRLTDIQTPTERSPHLPVGTPLSLQAAIEVSERQLDASTRHGLRTLSIFPAKPNSFTEEAALAVSGLSESALDTLTDAGLLESYGPGRYTLHQTIADYATLHRADAAAEEKFVRFFAAFVETHQHAYDLLEKECGNILAACDVAFSHGMSSALYRSVNLLAPFLEARGLYDLAEKYLEQAQQAALTAVDDEGLGTVWFHLGRIARLRGDLLLAERFYHEGLTVARKITNPELISQLLAHAGEVIVHRGDCPRAEQYLLEGLELARELDNRQRMSFILRNLGEVADYRGNHAQGNAFYLRGLELARQVDDWETMGALLQNLGVKAEWRGDYALADTYYQEAMTCAHKIRDQQRISALLMNMGMLAFRQERYPLAEKYYLEALELARKLGNRLRESAILQNLGMLARARDQFVRASSDLQESLRLAREIGNEWLINETTLEIAELHLRQQQMDQATELFQQVWDQAGKLEARDLMGFALYGLARVEARRENYHDARRKGDASLALFETMDHAMRQTIAAWFATLPSDLDH